MANLANGDHKTNERLYHIIIMHMPYVISKKIKASFRDALMEETHIKEKYDTKNSDLVFEAQNSQFHQPKLRQLV